MAFKTIQADDVVGKIIQELRRSGLSYFPVNSKGRALSKILSREVQSSNDFFNANFDKAFTKYATGRLLESICQVFGIIREPATVATTFVWENSTKFYVETGTFGDLNGGSDFTIGVGERIWTGELSTFDEPIYYTVTSPVVCRAGSSSVYFSAEADGEGRSFNTGANTLTNHNFTGYTLFATEGLKVKNNFAIVNGQDRESDDDLRFRLANAATGAEKANETAVRLALLSIPGLVDSKIIPYYDGIGTSAAFMVGQGNETPVSMLTQAQRAIERVGSNGNMLAAYAPPQVGVSFITRVNLASSITINEQNELTARLQDMVRRTVLDVRIGGTLYLNFLVRDLLRTSGKIISLGSNPAKSPFDQLYIYRTSSADSSRVRYEWLDFNLVTPEAHEILITEYSLATPFIFNWQVYE